MDSQWACSSNPGGEVAAHSANGQDMIQRLRTLILNLLRIVKHFAASTFIHRKTPTAAYPDTPLSGTIQSIASVARQTPGQASLSFLVKILLDEQDKLIIRPGMINVDFADVRTVMSEMGQAMMGTGSATGENRAREAAEAAIASPLLEDVDFTGARGVLVNITAGMDMSIGEFELYFEDRKCD